MREPPKLTFQESILTVIFGKLFLRDAEILVQETKRLIAENTALGQHRHGFLFSGKFYTELPPKAQKSAVKQYVHPSLVSAAKQLHEHHRTVEKDALRIRHGLSLVLAPCRTFQDVRDALPDFLRGEISELSSLPRTRPEAWAIINSPLLFHQYQQTSNLLSFYFLNRILY